MKIFYTFYNLSTGKFIKSVDRQDPVNATFFIIFYRVTDIFNIYNIRECFLFLYNTYVILFLYADKFFDLTCNPVEFLTNRSNSKGLTIYMVVNLTCNQSVVECRIN